MGQRLCGAAGAGAGPSLGIIGEQSTRARGLGGLECRIMRSSYFHRTHAHLVTADSDAARDLLKIIYANRGRQGLSYVLSGRVRWVYMIGYASQIISFSAD